jgi:nicotinate-nucleotide pyrophosphorylase (carboxylating)
MKYPLQLRIPEFYLKKKIEEFLLEDAPQGDITTSPLFDFPKKITANIIAKEDLVFAGEQLIYHFFNDSFDVELHFDDGILVGKNSILASITGTADKILTRERVLLNLLQRTCGIATLTKKYVDIAKPYKVMVLDTRKTTPGLRFFEKFAVAVAGGFNHRLNLSSGVLIKDNHIAAAGSISLAVEKIKLMKYALPIELEVDNLEQIKEGLEAGIDGLLLDNMAPKDVRIAVEFIRSHPAGSDIFIEASGGINLETLEDYCKAGIDAVSVGALTHSFKSSDISMDF